MSTKRKIIAAFVFFLLSHLAAGVMGYAIRANETMAEIRDINRLSGPALYRVIDGLPAPAPYRIAGTGE